MNPAARMTRKYTSFGVLVLSDTAAIFLSLVAAFLLRTKILPLVFTEYFSNRSPVIFHVYINRWYIIVILAMAVFAYERLYTKRHAFWEETRLLVKGSTIFFGLLMALIFVTQEYFPFSRMVVALAWIISFGVLAAFRRLTKTILRRLGVWRKRVLIIGSTNETAEVIEAIQANRTMGYEIVGCLTDDRARIGSLIQGVPILGHYNDIEVWKEKTAFEDIIVTFPNIPRNRLIDLLKTWESVSESIRYIPQTGDLITTGIEIENIGKILSLVVRKNLHKPWNILLKSGFEYALAFILIVLLAPIMLIAALAVKVDSPGPVFYLQKRIGRKGRTILIVKFRTMYGKAEERLAALLQNDPESRKEWETFKKLKSRDPRVTRVGAFLRRHSLDELPQLFNVLNGEMSLVGPRPYLQSEVGILPSFPALLFEVKPGITGMWQISGRSDISFEERLRIDEHYIRNWSLWMDIMILLKTFEATITGRGAF